MDREDYLKEAETQLSDPLVYENIEGDAVSPLIKTIKTCLAKIARRGDISKEALDYFLVPNPKLGRLYLLPKIHKRLHNVPGRPVISNSSFFTENISTFIDHHLQPLSQTVKSFIKDTNDFLKKIRDLPPLSKDTILCTIDVVGLYPNIPHNDGLMALKRALDKRTDKSISTDSLLELSECVLTNNIFEHNGSNYRQIQGTAMGTKMAPSYAILFMADFEDQFLKTYPLRPKVWWRYIDDIFILWEHGEDSLKTFLKALNKVHPTIKFTADYSTKKVNFLDVEITFKGTKLHTDLYTKPTDTHQYLEASSCHPAHCKRSIAYSQALRLNRICSDNTSFDKRCNELEAWLVKRGYSEKLVRSKVLQARGHKRNELLDKEKNIRENKLTFNLTFHPAFQNIYKILHKTQIILACDREHQSVFRNIPTVGFRRGKSLKDMLVRAKVPEISKGIGESCGCSGGRCGVCPYIKNTSEFFSKSGRKYTIRTNKLNCNSTNVVYLLTCKACGVQYVGSCITKFRLRFNNYKSCNNRHKTSIVPQQEFHNHFDQPGHHGITDWEITLIDQGDNEKSVRKRERFWQYKLNTFLPEGLNDCEVPVGT